MGWKSALFKGKKVWAQVLDDGEEWTEWGMEGTPNYKSASMELWRTVH